MTTTTMTTIALSKLTASKANVRRVESEAGLTELCASIKAHGLLQNLTVRKGRKGKFEVVAGARRLAAIMAFVEANEAAYEAGQMTPDEQAVYEAKIARMDRIDATCIGHDPELMAFAGVRLFLNYRGEITVLRGLLKIGEKHELAARERAKRQAEAQIASDADASGEAETSQAHDPSSQPEQDMADGYSMALISDLTATRTAALAWEVSQRPDIGLALAVHALALRLFYEDRYGQGYGSAEASCVRITGTKQSRAIGAADPDNEAPFTAFRETKERLQKWLPEQKHGESFFKRISKKMIAGALTEAGCAPQIAKAILDAPKAEAVQAVLEAITQKGWTPPPLRGRAKAPETAAQAGVAESEADAPESGGAVAGNGDDEAGALGTVYGPDDSGGSFQQAAE